ncbi:MAG: hypothetical protein C0596_01100 [Marinilabiliales bacterium]|nr:MAG: hypothetical protein C0596_01100 [Marinilabiliales bacterium]
MKMKALYLIFALIASVAIVACGGSDSKKYDNDKDEDVQKEFVIKCDNQTIYTGPGEESGGLVNEIASDIQGFETYYAVWGDDQVELLEEDGEWVKVKLMSGPNNVTGWIPESCLDR